MKKLLTSLFLIALSTPSLANAKSYVYTGDSNKSNDSEAPLFVSPHAKTGYVGGSLGYANAELSQNWDDDFGYKLYLGYRVNNYFAYELSYADLGKAKDASSELDTSTVSLSLLAMYPVNEYIDVYGKIGGHRWSATQETTSGSVSDDSVDIMFGAGLDYNIDKFTIRTEYERFVTDEADIDFISLGGQLHF